MSRIDKMIASDLAALGENSRLDVPAFDDAMRTNDAYRDDRPGAEARRNALAEERRRELVLMPLTLSHVFAHRMGRIAAGGMAMLASLVMLFMCADPMLARLAAFVIPGLNVGMLILIALLAIVASYVVASWFAEAWFARRMRAAIKTGDDPHQDIDQLARGPIEIAHAAVQKLDGWSIGVTIAGFAAVTCAFGYCIAIVGIHHTISYAWSMQGVLATGALEKNVGMLLVPLTAIVVGGLLVGRACMRETVLTSTVGKALSSWMALVVTAVIAIVTAYNGLHVMFDYNKALRPYPSEQMQFLLAIGSTICVFVPLAWTALFWRRREIARIG